MVAGNIGEERRLEFTVIGGVANVGKPAGTADARPRNAGTPVVVSGDLIAAVRREGRERHLLKSFAEHEPLEVRGRRAPAGGASGR